MDTSQAKWVKWAVSCPRCQKGLNDDTAVCDNCDHTNIALHRTTTVYFNYPSQTDSAFRCTNCQKLQFVRCPDCGASISAGLASGWHPKGEDDGCAKSCGLGCLVLLVASFTLSYCQGRQMAHRQAQPAPPTPFVDYTAQVLGDWRTGGIIVHYAPDHTCTVTEASSKRVVERGVWTLQGRTYTYTPRTGFSETHELEQVDGSTLTWSGRGTWQRVR